MAAPGTTGKPEEKLSEEQITAISSLFGLLFNVPFILSEKYEGQSLGSLGLSGSTRIVIKREPGAFSDSYYKAFRVVKDILEEALNHSIQIHPLTRIQKKVEQRLFLW